MTTPTIIMVAPNGARKTQLDHPRLPVTIGETATEARACYDAGASILHAHVRNTSNEHDIDPGSYLELIREMHLQAPEMIVQITTEAVGRFSPAQQVACVQTVKPEMASVALKEITTNFTDLAFARHFFSWCDEASVHIQHILYSAEDLKQFHHLKQIGIIPATHRCVLFVLGRYAQDFQSSPADLTPFTSNDNSELDWFVCAFGTQEQASLLSAVAQGGHARIGFENNLHLADGTTASRNAELVQSLSTAIKDASTGIANAAQAREILGAQVRS